MNKFLNIKIGVEFFNLLNTHHSFINNWKAVSPSFYFLQRIANHVEYNKGEPVTFFWENIKQIYRRYTNGEYRTYLNALVELGLLIIDETYYYSKGNDSITNIPPPSLQYAGDKADKQGECKKYLVTELGLDLLNSANLEYLKKLHTDRQIRRRNQKNISQRKVKGRTYSDYVLNYIHDGLINFEYDYNAAMAMVTGSNWSTSTQESVGQSLITFAEKTFQPLRSNEEDGRVFNEFVAMKSDLRKIFTYKTLLNKATVDIRACHPTFFSSYILTLPPSLQYAGDKADKLKKEHKQWVELFTDVTLDPREIIAKECGYDNDTCKKALNESINGSNKWKSLTRWLQRNFPYLCEVWETTDKARTGIEISKQFETRLMLDPQLYKYTEEMGIKLTYEYDGVSVFASNDDKALIDKCKYITNYLLWYSKEKWGVPVILKIELHNTNIPSLQKDFLTESRLHDFNLKLNHLKDTYERKHKIYIKHIRKTRGFTYGTPEDIKTCRKAKDDDTRARNALNTFIYEFKTENPDININE